MINVKYKLVHEDAKVPTKAHKGDMGYDLYPVTDYDYITIEPNETKLVDTGVQAAIPNTHGIVIKERSSLGSKGIKVSGGVVDAQYRGNIKVALYNTTNKPVVIVKYPEDFCKGVTVLDYENAIAQALFIPVPEVNTEVVDILPDTVRGKGGFGSTDK